jgi:hypothetical protein
MLKMMEKLVDRHIKDEIFELHALHRYKFAYQPGKSTETALHRAITHIEEALENGKVTLGAFLDIEGAFDITLFDIITKAAKWRGLGEAICRWIGSTLGGRKITTMLAGETLEGSVGRGYLQGGILSPQL